LSNLHSTIKYAAELRCVEGQWMHEDVDVPATTSAYCKTCADVPINETTYKGDGVKPVRSTDVLSYLCPAPYTRVSMTYRPAGVDRLC
ncbi:hypothetical protein PMAYCL1PPCAC_05320, partial [Pristionchus mayeri]